MQKIYTVIIMLFCCMCISLQAEGVRSNGNYKTTAQKVTSNIKIDGYDNEQEWKTATRHELKYDIYPGDNSAPAARTEFSTMRDEENLYFAFYCYDPNPSQIRAHMSERDRIFSDDFIIIIVDAFKDNQRVYEYAVNPFGIQGDLLRMGNNEDDTYDALWYSAGQKTDYGYFVEMSLPFKALRFPNDNTGDWGLQVLRIYPRDNRYTYSWTPNDRNNPCMMCQAGVLDGMQNIKIPTSYEVLPYIAGFQKSSLIDEDVPSKGLSHQDVMGRMGVGFKITPSSELVMEGVINPDFSQIESDAQQISVNSTFALFYPEKRPFFLEGSEIFTTFMNTYHSRMINNPLYASKITGKKGKVSYGLVVAQDRNTPFMIPGEEGSDFVSSDLQSFSTVGRLRYDFGEDTYIGGITTNRFMKGAENTLQGADFKYLFWKNYYLRGQVLFSQTKELQDLDLFSDSRKFGNTKNDAAFNGESYNGTAFRFGFSRYTKDFELDILYRDVSPGFQGHLGFISPTDSRSFNIENSLIFYPDSSILTRWNPFISTGMTWNHSSTQKERYIFVGGNFQFKGQVSLFVGFMPLNDEMYRNKRFDKIYRTNMNLFTRPISELTLEAWAEIGKFIYRDDIPELGTGHYLGSSVSLRLTEKFQSNFSYNRARLSNVETEHLYYDLYILRNVSSYQFNQEFSCRIIFEYNSDSRAFSMFPLASYKINPFTIFYLGATANLEDIDHKRNFIQTERQYFAKLQYMLNH